MNQSQPPSGATPSAVVICGSSKPQPATAAWDLAYEIGRLVAQAGFPLANGGYGGIMEASARGAREAGGRTIGVTCTAFKRSAANPYIDHEIPTDSLNQRLDTLLSLGRAYLILPGGTGTLLEIAMLWESMNKRFLPKRPIIFVGQYWKPLIDTLVDSGEVEMDFLHHCPTLDDLKQTLVDLSQLTKP